MDNGIQAMLQPRNTQNRSQATNQGLGPRPYPRTQMPSMEHLWDNPTRDNSAPTTSSLSSSAQRLNSIGASDNSRWPSWTSDTQQLRQSASRSASPPTSQQGASNPSPSTVVPPRPTTLQNSMFSASNYAPFSSQPTTSYSAYPESSQPDAVASPFQATSAGLQRNTQGRGPYDDSRDSMLPPSRHSENEPPLQFGTDFSAFSHGFGTHSRQQSRMSLSSLSNSYTVQQQQQQQQQQQGSRSYSHSYNPNSDQAQVVYNSVRAQPFRDSIPTTSADPRASVTQGSSPVPSQIGWQGTGGFGLSAGNFQDTRRDSMASLHNSSLNSPRTFGAPRQADTFQSPTAFDLDTLSRLQRAQQNTMSRQSAQLPSADSATALHLYEQQVQLMQQVQAGFPLPFQAYGYQTGQPFLPPSGPAGIVPRAGRSQDLTVGIRSAVLEEFRRSAKSSRKWELKNVWGHVVEFAGDQQGSRFLQEKIPGANSDDRQRVFDEAMVDANALMVDVFGNYVVQQLFAHGTMVQKRLLAGKMKNNVLPLSLQQCGCRCVQEAIEYILVEQQVELASELEPDLLRVMNSDNGNHVVQKILTKLPRERIDFVYDAVRGRVAELSQQPYACRVIQRMIEKGTAADKAFILKEFHEVAKKLATHQWGNYVVQAVIKHGGDEARAKVIRLCLDQFFPFSKEKVASNVMEHCILYGTEGDRLAMYRLLTHQAEDGSSLLQAMWKDQFANYVVQRLCHCLVGAEQAALVKASRPYFEARKKPGRPDDKWVAFEKLVSQFSAPSSRQGSISSHNASGASRPPSQADIGSAMPTPGLTTGGNSPRTNSSHGTNEAALDPSGSYLADQFSKASLHDMVNGHAA